MMATHMLDGLPGSRAMVNVQSAQVAKRTVPVPHDNSAFVLLAVDPLHHATRVNIVNPCAFEPWAVYLRVFDRVDFLKGVLRILCSGGTHPNSGFGNPNRFFG